MNPQRRTFDRLAVSTVILAAGALSFSELYQLGRAVSWPPALAWLLPVAVDVYALVSTRLWLSTPGPSSERSKAARNALAAIALSVVGNTVEHLAQAHVLAVGWVTVVIVSAIPPAVMALTVHLAAELGGNGAEAVAALPESAPELDQLHAETAPVPAVVERKAPAESAPQLVELVERKAPAETETVQVSARIPAETESAPAAGGKWSQLPEAEKVAAVVELVELAESAGDTLTGAQLGRQLGVTDRTGRTYLRKAQELRRAPQLRVLA